MLKKAGPCCRPLHPGLQGAGGEHPHKWHKQTGMFSSYSNWKNHQDWPSIHRHNIHTTLEEASPPHTSSRTHSTLPMSLNTNKIQFLENQSRKHHQIWAGLMEASSLWQSGWWQTWTLYDEHNMNTHGYFYFQGMFTISSAVNFLKLSSANTFDGISPKCNIVQYFFLF